MFGTKIKKGFISLFSLGVLSLSINACGTNDDYLLVPDPLLNNSFKATNISSYVPKYKYGLKITSDTPKVLYDEIPFNGISKKVDLRSFSSPVGEQGDLGACTGFSIAKGLREFLLNKHHKPFVPLSPLFLYYNERKIEDVISDDSGAAISDGMKVLKNTGVSPESDWPYDITKFAISPPKKAFDKALEYRVSSIKPLRGISDIKAELSKGNGVVFGIEVYESFENAKDGKIPLPNVDKEKNLGGHAVFCLGYDDIKKVMIVKNSWGKDWGDKGYFYLPYEFFKKGLVDDAWTAN